MQIDRGEEERKNSQDRKGTQTREAECQVVRHAEDKMLILTAKCEEAAPANLSDCRSLSRPRRGSGGGYNVQIPPS